MELLLFGLLESGVRPGLSGGQGGRHEADLKWCWCDVIAGRHGWLEGITFGGVSSPFTWSLHEPSIGLLC